MKLSILLLTALLPVTGLTAQTIDTTHQLHEIVVEAYLHKQNLLQVPTSTSVISNKQFQLQPGATLVPAMNTVPGVRMEERSPGSYRLSVRGSLLRSPFGIRNVKIYMDEMPLTDAGGNTYLNLADPGAIQSAEILKGPDGSLFGANSGGVILLHPLGTAADTTHLRAGVQGGSYGLFHEKAGYQQQWGPYQLSLYQAYQQSDGYRANSALKRYYVQTAQQWQYNAHNQLKLLAFYSDLRYRTPGGLTLAQSLANPRAARPATATLPGAETQQAAIYNRTFQGGLVHEANISSAWKHVITVFGATTHFENPFITNYEARDENTAGVRTYISLHDQRIGQSDLHLTWNTGLEWQVTSSDIVNYGNRAGKRDTVQAADKLRAQQHFYFTSVSLRLHERWIWEAAVSLNYFRYNFNEVATKGDSTRNFSAQLMPRLSLSYLITPELAARVTVSRGYSTPAIAEVRASDNIINNTLQAENGWNHEAGLRMSGRHNRFWIDASVYYYRLQHAIVRKLHDDGTEFFTNAGGTRQTGVEAQGMLWIVTPRHQGLLRGLQWQSSYTYSHFRFSDYNSAGQDFSGNQLTGVPKQVIVNSLLIQLPANVYLFGQHNYTDRLPLDDANTAFARSYHLVQCKVGWQLPMHGKCKVAVFAGSDNMLNQSYSLGNDLNAVGARYYNPAPERSYFGGVDVLF
ncbi:TonB-dependent receptor plug domain-containing protein [Chitinophaga agrisoli]|uniref:TonB-dependent receptor plug domain-containing protein n=1 Tax=Chitinophaga agrisoli TaxID=2607653 RepID=A0A5B2VTH3_9BACT|nr:TonB-dependent receptor [Chitinophaga agrisoli]KAA2241399.1 TonB-dependent receptor plug domain-containing protein [Chitinophaga agrisoli]